MQTIGEYKEYTRQLREHIENTVLEKFTEMMKG